MPTVGALLAFPSVLVLEAFCCHLAGSEKKVLRESRAELFVTPGGMTSQLQLLDVCKLFKDRNKYSYQDWMRSGEQEVAAETDFTSGALWLGRGCMGQHPRGARQSLF